MSKKVKLVKIEGGKDKEENIIEIPNDGAFLVLPNGEQYHLNSFVLSGQTSKGDRVAFAWNASLDEQVLYKNALNIQIDDQVRAAFRSNN